LAVQAFLFQNMVDIEQLSLDDEGEMIEEEGDKTDDIQR
jgi:hypothetical protein